MTARRSARKQKRPASTKHYTTLVTLALEWFLNPDHLPLVVAKEQGFFHEEGLDLSILVPTVPEESLDLVARGKADFGVGEQTNLIKARSQGAAPPLHRPSAGPYRGLFNVSQGWADQASGESAPPPRRLAWTGD